MALTDKKRKFVVALQSGLSGAKAAIAAGYSENGAAQAASRLMKDPDVIAALERKAAVEQANAEAKAQGKQISLPDLGKMYSDPKEFLRALMNDPTEDMKLRLDAAKSLMPFTHERKGEASKKSAKDQQLSDAMNSGRFSVAAPPSIN
ncbi:MAG: terminase small subunit [Halothiobacillaceae bacterium]